MQGSGRPDSVPALLTPGERVVPKGGGNTYIVNFAPNLMSAADMKRHAAEFVKFFLDAVEKGEGGTISTNGLQRFRRVVTV